MTPAFCKDYTAQNIQNLPNEFAGIWMYELNPLNQTKCTRLNLPASVAVSPTKISDAAPSPAPAVSFAAMFPDS